MTTATTQETRAASWDAEGRLEVLTFDLQGETFALEAGEVREILDLLPETAVPGAPPLVGAVINFRGKVIPVADLRVAFGMHQAPPTLDSRIVVISLQCEGQPCLVGLKADKVHEVTTLSLADSEEPPRVGVRWRPDYIRRLVKRGGDLIVLPDLERVFSSFDEAPAPKSALVSSNH